MAQPFAKRITEAKYATTDVPTTCASPCITTWGDASSPSSPTSVPTALVRIRIQLHTDESADAMAEVNG